MSLASRSATGGHVNATASPVSTALSTSYHVSSHTHQPVPATETLSHRRPADNSTLDARPFDEFASTLRRDLAPASQLENVLVDRIILSAWRLHGISVDEIDAARDQVTIASRSRAASRAEDSLENGFVLLEAARRACQPRWGQGRAEKTTSKVNAPRLDDNDDTDDARNVSNEWPIIPPPHRVDDDDRLEFDDDDDDDADDSADLAAQWNDRLVFDDNVSDCSPVVKGTWVTVSHVVSLVVDGWTWSDILRTHPELTEDDIRACLAYTVHQDNSGEY